MLRIDIDGYLSSDIVNIAIIDLQLGFINPQ